MMVFPMCGISIVNISPDYRNLLYRLRSLGDEKEISVMTKQGVIKPGNSQQILIEISNEQLREIRVVLKIILLSAEVPINSFDECWAAGIFANAGFIRKVVTLKKKKRAAPSYYGMDFPSIPPGASVIPVVETEVVHYAPVVQKDVYETQFKIISGENIPKDEASYETEEYAAGDDMFEAEEEAVEVVATAVAEVSEVEGDDVPAGDQDSIPAADEDNVAGVEKKSTFLDDEDNCPAAVEVVTSSFVANIAEVVSVDDGARAPTLDEDSLPTLKGDSAPPVGESGFSTVEADDSDSAAASVVDENVAVGAVVAVVDDSNVSADNAGDSSTEEVADAYDDEEFDETVSEVPEGLVVPPVGTSACAETQTEEWVVVAREEVEVQCCDDDFPTASIATSAELPADDAEDCLAAELEESVSCADLVKVANEDKSVLGQKATVEVEEEVVGDVEEAEEMMKVRLQEEEGALVEEEEVVEVIEEDEMEEEEQVDVIVVAEEVRNENAEEVLEILEEEVVTMEDEEEPVHYESDESYPDGDATDWVDEENASGDAGLLMNLTEIGHLQRSDSLYDDHDESSALSQASGAINVMPLISTSDLSQESPMDPSSPPSDAAPQLAPQQETACPLDESHESIQIALGLDVDSSSKVETRPFKLDSDTDRFSPSSAEYDEDLTDTASDDNSALEATGLFTEYLTNFERSLRQSHPNSDMRSHKFLSELEEHHHRAEDLSAGEFEDWDRGLDNYFEVIQNWQLVESWFPRDPENLGFAYNAGILRRFLSRHTEDGVILSMNDSPIGDALVRNAVLMHLMGLHLSNVRDGTCKDILAMEFDEVPIQSLETSIVEAFDTILTAIDTMSETKSTPAPHPKLRHLVISNSELTTFGPCLNQFRLLVTLDLSRNKITGLSDTIDLPHLLRLDISDNKIESLDFLQQLKSLRFLDASRNQLISLKRAVHVLLPLQSTLFSIDLVGNAICEDISYATTVVDVLCSLHYLDGYDLHQLALGVKGSKPNAFASPPSSAGAAISFKGFKRRPALPRVNKSTRVENDKTAMRIARALRHSKKHFLAQHQQLHSPRGETAGSSKVLLQSISPMQRQPMVPIGASVELQLKKHVERLSRMNRNGNENVTANLTDSSHTYSASFNKSMKSSELTRTSSPPKNSHGIPLFDSTVARMRRGSTKAQQQEESQGMKKPQKPMKKTAPRRVGGAASLQSLPRSERSDDTTSRSDDKIDAMSEELQQYAHVALSPSPARRQSPSRKVGRLESDSFAENPVEALADEDNTHLQAYYKWLESQ